MTTPVTDSPSAPDPSTPDPLPVDPSTNYNLGGTPPPRVDAAEIDNKAKDKAGRTALNHLMAPIKWELTAGRVLATISAILAVAPYAALVQIGNVLLEANATNSPINTSALWSSMVVLLVAFLLRLAAYTAGLSITHFADIKFRTHLRTLMLDRLGRAPLAWFTSINSGRVRKVVQDDATMIHFLIAHTPVEGTAAVVQPLALLAYAFYLDWRLGLIAIFNLPFFALTFAYWLRDMGEKTAEMDTRLAKISATMVEFVSGISVVKAFGRVGKAHTKYRDAADEFATFYLAWCEPMLKGNSLASSWISVPIMLFVNIGLGSLVMGYGYATPVELLATALISLLIPAAIMQFATGAWVYQIAGGAALRIRDTLETPILAEPEVIKTPEGFDVVFDGVSFAYDETTALEDINLTLPQGSVTALIGPSGSGKSTLATMVARFQDPDQGSVAIGGVDIRQINPDDLYRYVAFVLQDPQLLRTSIRANIALGNSRATHMEIEAAAKAAHIHEDIMAMPKGYDTIIGEDTNVSGGQAQRIAIARALLIDAPILVLDEATASTDPDTEAEIQLALNALVQHRTVLVIAHRLSAIEGADQIVVLEQGHIVAKGTHEEIKDDPHYQTLLAMNAKA